MSKYDTTTIITKVDLDWLEIKDDCMATVGKAAKGVPGQEWKRKLLLCEHSPIRESRIAWKWPAIPYAISTHFVRHHEGVEKFVQTSRADRTEVKDRSLRSQMDPVIMKMSANIQGLHNVSYKRLCMQADPTTRAYWTALVEQIKENVDEDVAWSMVPQCVRCGGCVEPFADCHFYENLMEGHTLEEQMDVGRRYEIYGEHRDKIKALGHKDH